MTDTSLVLVGSRTTRERRARGRGVGVFRALDDGTWEPAGELPAENPSFLVGGTDPETVYVVHGDGRTVSRLRLRDAEVARVQEVDTGGTNPVHLAVSEDGAWLLVVNHSGSVVSLPLADDQAVGEVTGRVDLTGTPGPHADQGRARPHHVVQLPGTDRFLVPDKGLDALVTLRLDPVTGRLSEVGRGPTRQAAGPRHVALHPNGDVAYTVDELASTVTVFRLDGNGVGTRVQIHPTLRPDDVRDSRAAEIALSPDGRNLYVSNRSGAGDAAEGGPGSDTIARFTVGPDRTLTPAGHFLTGGIRPRFFTVAGEALFVAHEASDTVTRLDLDAGGTPGPARVVARTGSPVCLHFPATGRKATP